MSLKSLLNRRCDIRTYTHATDAMGGVTKTASLLARSVLCRVQALTAEERDLLSRETVQITHRVFMEYRNDVTADMVILFPAGASSQRTFQIHHVDDPDEMHHHLELMVEERV